MYLMTYPIDVALMDDQGSVVAMYRDLAPGTRSHWHGDAHHALEVPAGTLAETHTMLGDMVKWNHPGRLETRMPETAPERSNAEEQTGAQELPVAPTRRKRSA